MLNSLIINSIVYIYFRRQWAFSEQIEKSCGSKEKKNICLKYSKKKRMFIFLSALNFFLLWEIEKERKENYKIDNCRHAQDILSTHRSIRNKNII
jgi:hypothetical protein